ncbi:hypothetical protein ACFLT9_11565 [Acidobacteriota bacterium]
MERKSPIFILFILVMLTTTFTQEIQEEAVAVNIEVPVRVFRGDRFVADLKIDVFELKKKATFDVDNVKQAFADSSISSHFLYITKPPDESMELEKSSDLKLDQSGPIFSAFREVAEATGGLVESSLNPEFAFKRAVDASENYYLLYYSPQNYTLDGKFKNIEIKIKGKNYRISHRAGYFAN